jgi:hypothetical protein
MRSTRRAWAAFAAGVVGLFCGLALDRALFWTDDSFLVLLALPTGLLMAGLCYWAMPLLPGQWRTAGKTPGNTQSGMTRYK